METTPDWTEIGLDSNEDSRRERPIRSISDIEAVYAADRARREQRVKDFFESRDTGRALYRDESGEPVLRDSIAAFVDELGFAQRVSTLTDDELREHILRYDASSSI